MTVTKVAVYEMSCETAFLIYEYNEESERARCPLSKGRSMSERPATPEVRLEYMTTDSVEGKGWDKAILPVAATEYHGPHLPYGTDSFGAETVAEAIARGMGDMLVLPTITYGVSHHHLSFPWTLSIRPETLICLIRDIGEGLVHHGIRKLMILTAHDGNPGPAEAAARILHQDHGISTAILNGWQGKGARWLAGEWDIDEDHGGQSELSMVMYGKPETARPDLATAQPNQFMDIPFEVVGDFGGTVPKGYSGDGTKASVEEGKAIVDAVVANVVPFLKELDDSGWKRGSFMSRITE